MVAKDDASCFEAPPVVALVVGYFLTTGIVVSYIPQVAPLAIFLWINPPNSDAFYYNDIK